MWQGAAFSEGSHTIEKWSSATRLWMVVSTESVNQVDTSATVTNGTKNLSWKYGAAGRMGIVRKLQ